MTTPTDIDRDAPVIADHEIDITAPLDTVWSLHTRAKASPSWTQEMTGASLAGPFESATVHVDQNGFTVTSTIYEARDHPALVVARRMAHAPTSGASNPPPSMST